MDRKRYVLAVMASVPQGTAFTPAQIQKLFFLVDREAPTHTGGPYFSFSPYDYGPFDPAVYAVVESLKKDSLAVVDRTGYFRQYLLTPEGHSQGQSALQAFTAAGRDYARNAAAWIRSVSFQQLVTAIYDKYPEMKENSVFRA